MHRDFLRPLLFFSCFLFNRLNLVAILFTSSIHLQYSTDYSFSFVDLFLAICFGDKERGNSCIRNQRRNVFPKLATCLLSSIIFSMVSVFQSSSHPIRQITLFYLYEVVNKNSVLIYSVHDKIMLPSGFDPQVAGSKGQNAWPDCAFVYIFFAHILSFYIVVIILKYSTILQRRVKSI